MRPGLLAIGLILLVLGGIFYMLPVDTAAIGQTTTVSDDVDTASVRTETYNTHDTVTDTRTETTTDTRTDTIDTVDTGTVDTTDRTVLPTRTVDRDTTILTADDDDTTTTTRVTAGVADAPLQRQLAVLAMILGAILTILGLVLPDPEPRVSTTVNTTTTRTAAPASRRVYEREEERERRL